MPTGACGINCDVCKLNLMGVCSTCGPGKSVEAQQKLAAQKRILGAPCPLLECAAMNKLSYCLRDCNSFPCENFEQTQYPFSQGFLNMQKRRRKETPATVPLTSAPITVPTEYWDVIRTKDLFTLSNLTLAESHESDTGQGLVFRFLNEAILVDIQDRCLKRFNEQQWQPLHDPMLELVTLVYFNSVQAFHPVGNDTIGLSELKEAHFFQGPHTLKLKPLLERYGDDSDGLITAAQYMGGQVNDMADIAFQLNPFPRIPLYYLFWQGDEEFKPRMSVLFDRSIEKTLAADAIWGLVNLVSYLLLKGPRMPLDHIAKNTEMQKKFQ